MLKFHRLTRDNLSVSRALLYRGWAAAPVAMPCVVLTREVEQHATAPQPSFMPVSGGEAFLVKSDSPARRPCHVRRRCDRGHSSDNSRPLESNSAVTSLPAAVRHSIWYVFALTPGTVNSQ